MRILSNFHDYYDGVQRAFQGTGELWVRKSPFTEAPVAREPAPGIGTVGGWREQPCLLLEKRLIETTWTENHLTKPITSSTWYVLGFCGKVYFIQNDVNKSGRFIYSWEDWQKRRAKALKEKKFSPWDLEHLENYYNQAVPGEVQDLFEKYKTPLFLIKSAHWDHRIGGHPQVLFVNTVNLGALDFGRRMDAATTYQEIMMFMGGMAHPEPHMVQISDEDQLVKKGFDKRWSFRHRK